MANFELNAQKIEAAGIKFGIELEYSGINKARALQALRATDGFRSTAGHGGGWGTTYAVDDQGRKWTIVHDGSISPAGCEVVSPPLTYSDIPLLQRAVRSLKAHGAVANASCGQHVHISAPGLDAKAVTRLSRLFFKWDAHLRKACNVSSNRTNSYCKRLEKDTVTKMETAAKGPGNRKEHVKSAWYNGRPHQASRYHASRYNALNINSWFYRSTVEFRLFEGTTHAGKVKSHIQVAIAFTMKAIEAKSMKKDDTKPVDADRDIAAFTWGHFLKYQLGFQAEEFKTACIHLIERPFPGSIQAGKMKVRRQRAAQRAA